MVSFLRSNGTVKHSRCGVASSLNCVAKRTALPARVEITLFRIAQEALTNIAKHAHAGVVVILLEKTNQHVRFVIDDNGVGFDPDAKKSSITHNGLGLVSMRERAESVGGTWRVESGVGKGTRILVEIPEPVVQESHDLS